MKWKVAPSHTLIASALNLLGISIFFGSHRPQQWRFYNCNLVQVLSYPWARITLPLFYLLVCVVQIAVGNSNNLCWLEFTQCVYDWRVNYLFSVACGSLVGCSVLQYEMPCVQYKMCWDCSVFEGGGFLNILLEAHCQKCIHKLQ